MRVEPVQRLQGNPPSWFSTLEFGIAWETRERRGDGGTDLPGGVPECGERGQVLVRGLVPELDEREREVDLLGEGRDRARKVGRLERVDERVDEPAVERGVPTVSSRVSRVRGRRGTDRTRAMA